MSCNHQREVSEWIEEFENDWGNIEPRHWHYSTQSSTVDLDLHRYQCTQCKEIFYYSGRARDYYETGIKSEWIKGLDK